MPRRLPGLPSPPSPSRKGSRLGGRKAEPASRSWPRRLASEFIRLDLELNCRKTQRSSRYSLRHVYTCATPASEPTPSPVAALTRCQTGTKGSHLLTEFTTTTGCPLRPGSPPNASERGQNEHASTCKIPHGGTQKGTGWVQSAVRLSRDTISVSQRLIPQGPGAACQEHNEPWWQVT